MRTIAIANGKGGVSKTTISTNLAFVLSKLGNKVLLVDSDFQGNAFSTFFKDDPDNELADILKDECTVEDAIIEARENLHIIGSKKGSRKLREYQSGGIQQEPMIFYTFVEILKEDFDYDFLIFDCHPAMGPFEKSLLASCDEIITPLQPEAFGVDGLGIFNDSLQEIRKGLRSKVRHNKIIISMIDSRLPIHKKYIEDLKRYDQYKFYEIPVCVDFKKAQDSYKTIFEVESSNKTKIRSEDELYRLAGDL